MHPPQIEMTGTHKIENGLCLLSYFYNIIKLLLYKYYNQYIHERTELLY